MTSFSPETAKKYYSRKDIQEAILQHAQHKEIGVRYGEIFGKRPDILAYPQDVAEFAKQNVSSFHASEELWNNPLSLSSTLSKKDLDQLRSGWDLVLDIDCKVLEYSRICAQLIIEFLEYCEVEAISVKFSGNKGFHIGIPFEAFPEMVGTRLTKSLFPEAPQRIALYIKENIKDTLARRILAFENNDFAQVKEKVNLPAEELIYQDQGNTKKLNVERFLEIDTILLSSRHLYRMPYSLHEKSGLVSLPLDPKKIEQFDKTMAVPEQVNPQFVFLDRTVKRDSARRLLIQALDFKLQVEEEKDVEKISKQFHEEINSPIKQELFPPCMKLILQGVEDGKKRSVFILANYLGKIGWSKLEIEQFLEQWNTEKNRVPLREVYIKGQMLHFKPGDKLPPNCNNEAYYKSIGVCQPDGLCAKIRNPVNYTLIKWKRHLEMKEEEESQGKRKKKKTSENKESVVQNDEQPLQKK